MYNVKEFIQYVPGQTFRPFAEKVVKMRIEATYEQDDAKQLTAKLYGNSGLIHSSGKYELQKLYFRLR